MQSAPPPVGTTGGIRREERLVVDRFRMVWFHRGESLLPGNLWGVTIVRLTPPTGAMTLHQRELEPLVRLLAWWAAVRDRWHAYEEPHWSKAGTGSARYAAPNGAYSLSLPGNELFAFDEESVPEAPLTIAPGVQRIASLWHPEERIGPRGGAKVGVTVRLGESLHAWVLAGKLWLVRGSFETPRERLRIDHDETALVECLEHHLRRSNQFAA